MRVRINKIITWDDKKYAHVIDTEPNQFCDFCAFGELCQKVILKELECKNSPMPICEKLCDEENTNYANFLPAERTEQYVNSINEFYENRND